MQHLTRPACIRPALRVLAAGAALALVACGGGDSAPAPTPAGGPISNAADRIEPYDPGVAVVWKAAAPRSKAPVHAADALAVVPTVVVLDALAPRPAEAALPFQQQDKETPGGRQRIGLSRPVAATATPAAVRALLQWQATGQGTQRAALRFRSAGAFGVRLGVQVQALPPGSTLRFYGSERSGSDNGSGVFTVSGAEVLAAAAVDGADRTYWSPDFGGPETTLELELPAGADPAQLALAVPVLSHFFIAPAQAAAQSVTKALAVGGCSVDAACRPDLDAQSRSVALVQFMDPKGNGYLCTGTLLNDARSSTTPYLLTAQHCIGSQAAATTVITDWFYRASACNSDRLSPATQRVIGGATLLYASATTDTAFMRLNAPVPAGTVFAGSYLGAVGDGTDVMGMHQSQGDVQKVSEGRVQQFFNCSIEVWQSASALCQSASAQASRFLGVTWTVGDTEQGSSGSPLFVTLGGNTRYVAGQLLGGSSSCQEPRGADYYGRFDVAFNAALKQWLKPDAGAQPIP